MSKIAPELNDWMWRVAESRDAEAIQQFGDRYPELRSELANRIALVGNLKGVRPASSVRPQFVVPRQAAVSPWRMRVALMAAACATLAVVFAGVTVVQNANQPVEKTTTVEPIATTAFNVDPTFDGVKRDRGYHVFPKPEQSAPNPAPAVNPEVKPIEPLVTVRFDRIRLIAALEAIAADGGVQLEIAPNMPDIEVGMEYKNQPISAVLRHLGDAHGFQLLEQGVKQYLIVPITHQDPDTASSTEKDPAKQGQPTGPADLDPVEPQVDN